jgi:RNA polymerase sigma-70 factor (ECF subfamily)
MDPERRQIIQDAMVRLSDGDRSAFPALVDALWPAVLSFARRGWRGAGGDSEAEDVAQQVFLRICERIAEFDRRRDGLSWAFGIASYEILTQRRRRQRRREAAVTGLHAHADPSASQEESLMKRELAGALRELVDDLSVEELAMLGLTVEPGDASGAPRATQVALRKRRQRLLDRLRIAWRRMHGES